MHVLIFGSHIHVRSNSLKIYSTIFYGTFYCSLSTVSMRSMVRIVDRVKRLLIVAIYGENYTVCTYRIAKCACIHKKSVTKINITFLALLFVL